MQQPHRCDRSGLLPRYIRLCMRTLSGDGNEIFRHRRSESNPYVFIDLTKKTFYFRHGVSDAFHASLDMLSESRLAARPRRTPFTSCSSSYLFRTSVRYSVGLNDSSGYSCIRSAPQGSAIREGNDSLTMVGSTFTRRCRHIISVVPKGDCTGESHSTLML